MSDFDYNDPTTCDEYWVLSKDTLGLNIVIARKGCVTVYAGSEIIQTTWTTEKESHEDFEYMVNSFVNNNQEMDNGD